MSPRLSGGGYTSDEEKGSHYTEEEKDDHEHEHVEEIGCEICAKRK